MATARRFCPPTRPWGLLEPDARKRARPDLRGAGRSDAPGLPGDRTPGLRSSALGPVWTLAERRLIEADYVVIFGYSCPPLDFESANLLTRAQRQRADASKLSVIDPNGAIVTRYINLLSPKQLSYYASAHDFLEQLDARRAGALDA